MALQATQGRSVSYSKAKTAREKAHRSNMTQCGGLHARQKYREHPDFYPAEQRGSLRFGRERAIRTPLVLMLTRSGTALGFPLVALQASFPVKGSVLKPSRPAWGTRLKAVSQRELCALICLAGGLTPPAVVENGFHPDSRARPLARETTGANLAYGKRGIGLDRTWGPCTSMLLPCRA